ncbi:unnamed protein product [Oppiella nova]|uniref:DDB1- and CUL4-associated factor 5 n=1 Tax=Oppiella nova TaxID=334625 RepID=A0A7R9LPY8_9ACAR|nr:unnamed protein product [Oppiella nova]CAG2165823.1 unnamed protein product [Oppiella nova]
MSGKRLKNTTHNVLSREYNDILCQKYSSDLVRSRFESAEDLYHKDLYSHYGCVNAIEFSDNGQYMVSGGDDRRILLWDVQKAISGAGQPQTMKGEHNSNIFCLGFDSRCHRLFSAGNDELVMIHDSVTGETVDVILHNDAIYGLSVNPFDDNIFASACDDGRVCLWDLRKETVRETTVLARYSSAFHAVMYNPFESRLVVTANTKEGIAVWDVRKPLCVLQQYNPSMLSSQSAMSVRFNKTGTLILGLRRRLPPVLYNLRSSYPIVEFDDSGYYNSCTMKSCCFGGDSDQYILSGSDDFRLYMWRIPEEVYQNGESNSSECFVEKADLVLSGHRSIVNQVRYNYTNSVIASSGVEKVIKLWSSFPLPEGKGGLLKKPTYKEHRQVFSHEDYINLVLESGQFVTHDYSHQSVQEDPRMMAFFDSLVQRDIEGWTSDSSNSIDGESNFYELCWNTVHSDDSHSSNSSSHNSDNEDSIEGLNSHYYKYLDIISKRIEGNEQKSGKRSAELDPELATTSTAGSTTESVTTHPKAIRDRLVNESEDKTREKKGLNRISELITEKKREQLKKLIRVAVRMTRKKLKRFQKRSDTKGKYDVTANSEADKQRLEDLKQKLDYLAQRVNCQTTTSDSKADKQAFNSHRNYRRLRLLTNQSDLVFNEVLPVVSSSSSSDSDDSVVSGEELYNAISTEMSRMRSIMSADTDSSDSSSSSSVSLIQTNATNASTAANNKHKHSSSSSDEETNDKETDKQTISESKHNNRSRLSFLSSYADNDSDSDDEGSTTGILEPVIHCPYKHNLCHATTSTGAKSDKSDAMRKSSIFKPIDSALIHRTYRKRQKSGTVSRDKSDDKKSTNNDDNNDSQNANNNNKSDTNNETKSNTNHELSDK